MSIDFFSSRLSFRRLAPSYPVTQPAAGNSIRFIRRVNVMKSRLPIRNDRNINNEVQQANCLPLQSFCTVWILTVTTRDC